MPSTIRKMDEKEYNYLLEYDTHAALYEFANEEVGLRGYIAIHKKRGRLSTGGTRFRNYTSDMEALRDVLRLSSTMTAKCVVAGLPYGGAKCVIIGDPTQLKSEEFLIAYAEVVNMLQGEFFTGEDVGMTEEDVQTLIEHSPFFNGKTGFAGDPSPHAAQSVLVVMRKAIQLFMDEKELSKQRVAIKGLGKVGGALARLLIKDKARVVGADIDTSAVEKITSDYPSIEILPSEEVAFTEASIYAPCAFGREVRLDNFDKFKVKIICGGANNQLESSSLSTQLMKRGVLYVPDYLANAGGLINVSEELEGDGYHPERVAMRIANLSNLLEQSYNESQRKNLSLAESVNTYVVEQLAV